MKRDMEVVRELLFLIEAQDSNTEELRIPPELDKEVAIYHLEIMQQAGFINNKIQRPGDNVMWIYSSLTWDGHDFLEAIKNEGIWSKVKSGIKSKGLEVGQVSFELVKEYAKLELKKKLGME